MVVPGGGAAATDEQYARVTGSEPVTAIAVTCMTSVDPENCGISSDPTSTRVSWPSVTTIVVPNEVREIAPTVTVRAFSDSWFQ